MQTGITAHTTRWIIVILLGLVILFAAWIYWLNPQPSPASSNSRSLSQQDSALSQALNECDGITEKAALALPPATLEFQKLEHGGRKARVFRTCMHDRGYRENSRWSEYAQPLARQVANTSHVSVDEAMENLGRANMVRIKPDSDAPAYWTNKR